MSFFFNKHHIRGIFPINNYYSVQKVPDFFAGRKPDETQGLLQDRDDVWRVGRQTLSPTFSSAKIKAVSMYMTWSHLLNWPVILIPQSKKFGVAN